MSYPIELRIKRFQVELRGCGAQSTYVFYRKGMVAGQFPAYHLPFMASKGKIIAILTEYAMGL